MVTFSKNLIARPISSYFILRVKQEKFGEAEFIADDGMTIGRDLGNAVWIDDAEVQGVHARIMRDASGSVRIQCVGDATVTRLPDDVPLHELTLTPGLEFRMGSASIRCEERIALKTVSLEPPAIVPPPLLAPSAPPLPENPRPADAKKPAAPAECPRCRKLISTTPRDARFCPKCGSDLSGAREPSDPAAGPPPLPEALRDSVGEKVQAFFRSAAAPNADQLHLNFNELQSILAGYAKEDLPPTLENVHSLILLGYANALLKLGWRYEHGRGVAQNDEEAARCYQKSAKLGNVFAQAKVSGKAP